MIAHLIIAIHHGHEVPIIGHLPLKISRLVIHVQRTHVLFCKDRNQQCLTLGFLCGKDRDQLCVAIEDFVCDNCNDSSIYSSFPPT